MGKRSELSGGLGRGKGLSPHQKVVIIVISVRFKISTFFGDSHILSAKMSPEWRSYSGFGLQKTCPFLQNIDLERKSVV